MHNKFLPTVSVYFSSTFWGINKISDSLNGKGVLVAVLDTGVNPNHMALKSEWGKPSVIRCSRSFLGGNILDTSFNSHGTAVASIIAGTHRIRPPKLVNSLYCGFVDGKLPLGVAHKSSLVICKVSVDQPSETAIIKALRWIHTHNTVVMRLGGYELYEPDHIKECSICQEEAKDSNRRKICIINMSFSLPNDNSDIRKCIVDLNEQGVVCVAGMGNKGNNYDPGYPALYDNVLSVGAVDHSGVVSNISTRHQTQVDVYALGEDVLVAKNTTAKPFERDHGTSFASPAVAGLIAILVQCAIKQGGVELADKMTHLDTLKKLMKKFLLRDMPELPTHKARLLCPQNIQQFFVSIEDIDLNQVIMELQEQQTSLLDEEQDQSESMEDHDFVHSEEQEIPQTMDEQETPQTMEEQETPQTMEEQETPQTMEEQETPQTMEEQETPQTMEEQETPQTMEEQETTQTIEEQETPQIMEEQETPQTMEEQATPQTMEEQESPQTMEDQETTQTMEEQETPQTMEEQETSQTIEEQETPQIMEEQETPQTMEEQATPQTMEEQATPQTMEEQESPQTMEDQETTQTMEEQETPQTMEEQATPQTMEEQESPQTMEDQETTQTMEEQATPQTMEEQEIPQTIEEHETPQTMEEQETPQTMEEQETPQTTEEQETPQTMEEQETPQTMEEQETPQTTEEQETPQTMEEQETPQTMEEQETPQTMEEQETPQTMEEQETPQTIKELNSAQPMKEQENTQLRYKAQANKLLHYWFFSLHYVFLYLFLYFFESFNTQ